ncbi:MAG: DUF6328 family protein [Massilia sp.]
MSAPAPEQQTLGLKDEMHMILEEARMVLPGIQALIGFQTIAVFNQRFTELPGYAVAVHLAALALLAISAALAMTPAALNRLTHPHGFTRRDVARSSMFLTWGMLALMLAFALDGFVVLYTATEIGWLAVAGGCATLLGFAVLWFVFPLGARRLRAQGAHSA